MADHFRYGVMGAGLIGCYLGGLLAAPGRHVTLVGRGRIQGDIARHGLTLSHYSQAPRTVEGFVFATDAAALASCDVVLVCVKSPATASVAKALHPVIAHNALVVSFQNGLNNAQVLRAHLPERTVLPGLVPFNVTSPEPGRFHKGTEGALYWRTAPGRRVLNMMAAFESAGQPVALRDPMLPVLWGKLLLNLNNALNVLHGGPLRSGLVQREYRRTLAAMMREALAVLEAADIAPESPTKVQPQTVPKLLSLPTPVYRVLMDRVLRIDPTARSSMLEDLELGRPSENAYLQGEVIALGRRLGVPVEVNRRVAAAVDAAFAAGRSPELTGREMAQRFLA